MNKLTTTAALLALSFASAGWALAPAGDASRGREKVPMCQGCHGIPGWRTVFPEVYTVPRIGGQNPAYLVHALKGYRSGDRNHPSMKAIAATLSDEDIADLAAYYGQHDVKTAVK